MIRSSFFWALTSLCILGGWSTGCIVGGQYHRLPASFEHEGESATASGSISSIDLGVVADFRYLRLSFPFEGQRRKLELRGEEGTVVSMDEVVEMRTLRLDVPLVSFRDFKQEGSGSWYPGTMKRRTSLELWLSGSVGAMPDHPLTATIGLVYYRYGSVAVRLFGGLSMIPFEGTRREFTQKGGGRLERVEGYVPAAVGGIEVTLAAGEYALELVQFFLDFDRRSRNRTNEW